MRIIFRKRWRTRLEMPQQKIEEIIHENQDYSRILWRNQGKINRGKTQRKKEHHRRVTSSEMYDQTFDFRRGPRHEKSPWRRCQEGSKPRLTLRSFQLNRKWWWKHSLIPPKNFCDFKQLKLNRRTLQQKTKEEKAWWWGKVKGAQWTELNSFKAQVCLWKKEQKRNKRREKSQKGKAERSEEVKKGDKETICLEIRLGKKKTLKDGKAQRSTSQNCLC